MPASIKILLCAPRGFCAGVDRAIAMVEAALAKFGAPVYVRHEIVHNRHVVQRLEALGTIFVEELADIPTTTQPVIFSAHGVSKAVVAEAEARQFQIIDATCPLVSKVHREAEMLHNQNHHVLMVGHAGHAEVLGTRGQIPAAASTLVQTVAEAHSVTPPTGPLALVTQTTLSVDETRDIIAVLQSRFPHLRTPKKEDICYATTNRQAAVRTAAPRCERFIIVGAPNSSNSNRLVDCAKQYGCADALLVPDATALDALDWTGIGTVGLSSGASAPDDLVQGVIEKLRQKFSVEIEEVVTAVEDITFKIPQSLSA